MELKDFHYTKKDGYTQSDVDTLLAQFATAIGKETVSKEDYEAIKGELTPLKAEKRQSHLKTLVPDNANIDEYETLLALANVSDEDDDNTIKNKFKGIVEKKTFLQKPKVAAPEAVKTNKKIEKQPEPSKDEIDVDGL